MDYAERKNITLIAAPEGNRNAVSEHALGMILSLFNKLRKADHEIRNGKWLREDNRGVELEGKTVGIIGYGNTGKSFAKKLMGFDVKVICYDIKKDVGDQNAKQVDLDEIYEKTEVLSLHTPQTDLTIRMIDQKFINKFKKSFYLINTARGSAVIIKDLMNAINQNKILGACLDVLEFEKSSFENFFESSNNLPNEFIDLIASDKVLLSPHVAGWTVESKFKLADSIVKKVGKMIDQHKSIK
jgi:D-3-phosphoglycerate dehydrogenase